MTPFPFSSSLGGATAALARGRSGSRWWRHWRRRSRRAAHAARALATAPGAPLYGVTIDSSRTGRHARSLAALPSRPTTRVYFNAHEPASHYVPALARIDGVSAVMGELLDSSEEKWIIDRSLSGARRVLPGDTWREVNVWEVGNEVNGNWTGPYPDVAAKLTEAYDDVAASGAASALTLYANNFGPDNCGDGSGRVDAGAVRPAVRPERGRRRLSYVLLSYYPTQCGGREPTPKKSRATWPAPRDLSQSRARLRRGRPAATGKGSQARAGPSRSCVGRTR